MNRIPILAIIFVTGCLGLETRAEAQSNISNNSGSVSATCSITALPGTLSPTPNTINNGNFPIELTSSANPGKFMTLCNTASSGIKIQISSLSNPPAQGGSPYTATYSLSAIGSSAYVGNSILDINIPSSVAKNGTINHAFGNQSSELIVSGKLKATSGRVLGDGDYAITFKATLTP